MEETETKLQTKTVLRKTTLYLVKDDSKFSLLLIGVPWNESEKNMPQYPVIQQAFPKDPS